MSRIRSVSEMERIARPLATERAGVSLRHQPKGVPGRPDYANKSRKVAVFVHGCFWHVCKTHHKMPTSNVAFWRKKFARNVERHRQAVRALRKEGYTIITIWEHEVSRYAARAAGRSSRSSRTTRSSASGTPRRRSRRTTSTRRRPAIRT